MTVILTFLSLFLVLSGCEKKPEANEEDQVQEEEIPVQKEEVVQKEEAITTKETKLVTDVVDGDTITV